MAFGKVRARGFGRKVAGRRLGAVRRRPRGMRLGKQMYNPLPTFVETFQISQTPTATANVGGTFACRITDIPQIAQYSNLYNMYKVNWIKVILTPRYNSVDGSAYLSTGRGNQLPIMYSAVQDTPFAPNPATVSDVLQMNGARIQPITSVWSKSFKPTAAVEQSTGGANLAKKREVKQWYAFDTTLTGNNPLFQGIAYIIACAIQGSDTPVFDVHYKVCFSLRDPK